MHGHSEHTVIIFISYSKQAGTVSLMQVKSCREKDEDNNPEIWQGQ
jgi:hypothetical protein